ncbi:MAG: methyltransferase domain-containing protein [Bacteroidota bacterium]
MTKLPYLNLGCGSHFNAQWVNVDFSKNGEGVIAHNLLKGIPFADNTFEVVYHSHVLEHFSKDDGVLFIKECYRVLKPGGILRIAVPDLEQIVNNYARLLMLGKKEPDNGKIRADYEWMMIEMYDQTVRNNGGGEMLKYLAEKKLVNEDFVIKRIGYEGEMLRKNILNAVPQKKQLFSRKIYHFARRLLSLRNYRQWLLKLLFSKEYKLLELAWFRQSGEIHQWMYDIYSIRHLLDTIGFKHIAQKDFNESDISNWSSFKLDQVDNKIRKPDSLFVEAVK